MANIKSSKKRIATNEKKKSQNVMVKSDLKTSVKKLKACVTEGDKKAAEAQLSEVFSKLDHAAQENIIHKNKAANNKAALSKLVGDMDKKAK